MALSSVVPIQSVPVAVPGKDLRVIELDFHTDPRWEAFVNAHPDALVYHHPAWLQALEREYGQRCISLACVDAANDVRAVLPLFYTRGLPLGFGGTLIGPRLSSLPRTPVAGPLSLDLRATVALLHKAIQRVSQTPEIQLQIKTQNPELDGLVKGLVCTPWRLAYVLRLNTTLNGSFRVADSDHRYTIKKAIRKATRLGVRVRAAETLADLHDWYALYLDTMRRNFVPARPYRFFVALWELLRPKEMMRLLLAEQHTAGISRMLAGTIFLRFGRTMSCAFNGSWSSDLSLRPNDVIYWEAINDACRSGCQLFDFGEVAADRPELARYKIKWGSDPVRLHRYYYPATRETERGVAESPAYPKLLLQALWRHLPLSATARLSDHVYSYL